MGNTQPQMIEEQNIPIDQYSQQHYTSKHFQTKSNFEILKIGHFHKNLNLSSSNISNLKESNKKVVKINNQIKEINKIKQQQSQQIGKSQQEFYQEDEQQYSIKSFKTINFSSFIQFKTTKVTESYIFHGRIDGGSFGDVYKASLRTKLSKQSQDLRAIKAIPQSKANQAILKQVNMLRKLDHPNILKIYQVYRYNNMFYIITQYLPGGNLMQLVSKGAKYSQYYIASIMKELMSGLVYLHSNNIIHRDIKPQNLVFQSKPTIKKSVAAKENNRVAHTKLIDFGISIFKQQDKFVSGSVGTPYFMAPQVLVGCYDQKCDIWSCGVMLYFLLCGSLPFKGNGSNQIFNQILYHKPGFKEKEWMSLSKSAVSLIKNMLNKNRTERYSAKQVLESQWMKNRKTQEITFNEQTLQSLKTHGFQDNFTAIVKTYIASMTTSVAERRMIADKFMELDKDKSGFIDKEQLKQAFCKDGIPCPNIDEIIAKVDINKSGKIDFTQFLTVMTNQQTLFAKQRLAQAFQFLDSDNTGYIQMNQITQVLKNQNQNEVKNVLEAFDKNGDNKISKDQFINTMLQCSSGQMSGKSKKNIKSKKDLKSRKNLDQKNQRSSIKMQGKQNNQGIQKVSQKNNKVVRASQVTQNTSQNKANSRVSAIK